MAVDLNSWRWLDWVWRWGKLVSQKLLIAWQQPSDSDYLVWRHRFLYERLQICLWVAVPCFLTIVALNLYELFVSPQHFNQEIIQYFGNPDLPNRVRHLTVVTNFVIGILLVICLALQRTRWGQRNPALLFLCFSWSITLVPQIIGTHLHLPDSGGGGVWFLVFLAQATLMPVHWRLHLISQMGTVAYYVGVNPLMGTTAIEGKSIYSSGMFIYLFWFCFICDLAVYLYERLQRTEFESRRELRVFLHAVSHDLKTPVMGTSMVLQNLLKKPTGDQVTVNRTVLERLWQGSNRQLGLIQALLEAHEAEVRDLVLHIQPMLLQPLINDVLADLEPVLAQNQTVIHQQISPDLPPVHADATQIWRLYSNLLANAVKHNPPGVAVSLTAEVRFSWLYCTVQDNGLGISLVQQERLFELYSRGARARYMPGLGLGLYLCRQIINAHGGDIGVNSQPEKGTTFWFTLPLPTNRGERTALF